MIKAHAAYEPGGELKPFEYAPGSLGDEQVEINVEYCGICRVTKLNVGQRVGLGWYSRSCMVCEWCMSGNQNLCLDAEGTIGRIPLT
jgi:uncharacterized zinc-type alcohol dehydrogenase-like protein